ncbi:hypothetical protein KAR91_29905 [Candidatus Pacearchaeota archaeon]|nr:hypothetical protein [Candidatus Pacearchaeota archaeon]
MKYYYKAQMEIVPMFKVGELMTVSSGSYSDYCVQGLFKVLRDFNAQEQMVLWVNETGRVMSEHADVEADYRQKQRTKDIVFLAWLNEKGFVEDVPYRELNIGDCGETCLSERNVN